MMPLFAYLLVLIEAQIEVIVAWFQINSHGFTISKKNLHDVLWGCSTLTTLFRVPFFNPHLQGAGICSTGRRPGAVMEWCTRLLSGHRGNLDTTIEEGLPSDATRPERQAAPTHKFWSRTPLVALSHGFSWQAVPLASTSHSTNDQPLNFLFSCEELIIFRTDCPSTLIMQLCTLKF